MLLVPALAYVSYRRWKKSYDEHLATNFHHVSSQREHLRRVLAEKMKIVMGFVQVVTSLIAESGLVYPPIFTHLVGAFAIFDFDLFGFLSLGCIFPTTYYSQLTMTCLSPVILAGIVAARAYYISLKQFKFNIDTAAWKQKFWSLYLVVLFCVYAGVTRKVRASCV